MTNGVECGIMVSIETMDATVTLGHRGHKKMGVTMFRKNECGSTNLECTIIMLCLVAVAAVFVFGMFGAMEQTETQLSGQSDGMRDACVLLCRARFLDGITDICKFNACVTGCGQ